MHRTYHTEAIVLGLRPAGETSASARLYTRELGLISGWVQGARSMRSKLRYHVQPFSHSTISLVRGRELWRVTGAEEAPGSLRPQADHARLPVLARIGSMLVRFVAGEERDAELFDDVRAGFAAILSAEEPQIGTYEATLLLRFFHRLGYIADDPQLLPILRAEKYSAAADAFQSARPEAIRVINQALRESQL